MSLKCLTTDSKSLSTRLMVSCPPDPTRPPSHRLCRVLPVWGALHRSRRWQRVARVHQPRFPQAGVCEGPGEVETSRLSCEPFSESHGFS